MVDFQYFVDRSYKTNDDFSDEERFDVSWVVEEKINFLLSNSAKNLDLFSWRKLLAELSGRYKVQDMSYQQFPSLKFVLEGRSTVIGDFRIVKSTHVILSLLCPLYTCFHQFRSEFVTKTGVATIGSAIFLRDKLFENDVEDIGNISEAVTKFYPHIEFVYHIDLCTALLAGPVPWGVSDSNRTSFSAFEYLFDSEVHQHVFS